MECRVLRYVGKGVVCVQVLHTGAVISVRLPADTPDGVVNVVKSACAYSPVKSSVVLGEYDMGKFCFDCTSLTVESGCISASESTTKYKRVPVRYVYA